MAALTYPDYPPQLTAAQHQELLTNLKDWTISHGLAVRPQEAFVSRDHDPSGILATTAPVTLFPSLFPRSCFEQGLRIQKAYNELYAAISSNEDWLSGIVEELLGVDDFVAKLWRVHTEVKKQGYVQALSLGLFRSDYMVHVNTDSGKSTVGLKQVEFNTIASSFGGLSSKVSQLHRHLLSTGAYTSSAGTNDFSGLNHNNLPPSKAIPSLAAGLAAAHTAYGAPSEDRHLCLIFLVQDVERNVFDQRHLEYELLEKHAIRVFRLPFSKILDYTELDRDRNLIYTPPNSDSAQWEVTTVYLRAGYSPDDYPVDRDWEARLHLERSRAIKCPSVLTQLAGCKKVQQVLATPHSPHLRKFAPETATELLQTFAPIYPMDKSQAGEEARDLALNPQTALRYVLKPQREGGGNNVYRKAIPSFLETLPESQWPAYILMEMIEPPPQSNSIIRNGEIQQGGVICELGVYGVCLWRHPNGKDEESQVLENWEAGYLLRTKGDQSEEGGVAAGFGAVDSCYLIDI